MGKEKRNFRLHLDSTGDENADILLVLLVEQHRQYNHNQLDGSLPRGKKRCSINDQFILGGLLLLRLWHVSCRDNRNVRQHLEMLVYNHRVYRNRFHVVPEEEILLNNDDNITMATTVLF